MKARASIRTATFLMPMLGEADRDLVVAALLALGDRELSDAQRERLKKELREVSKIAQDLYEKAARKAKKRALRRAKPKRRYP